MQCSMPKKGMLLLVLRPLPYGVLVNPPLVGEGIREALKEGND